MGVGWGGTGPGQGGAGCAEVVALSSNHTARFGINYESQSCCCTSIHQTARFHYQPLNGERNDYWEPFGGVAWLQSQAITVPPTSFVCVHVCVGVCYLCYTLKP